MQIAIVFGAKIVILLKMLTVSTLRGNVSFSIEKSK
ncbi:hypothetical protein SAMN05421780_101395 [Flexibacter flexilis DSM 6793]|uniref:Uncharacterized protein n=1 Tax=Flexibacter flexilis DSM 6793 TaxID=927664 RepID=A0A1I1DVJ1_9BACT|nr:hypothetical protein SAMN05421780_101395 [Flexibacter flexilis DSM 6793]